MDVTDFTLVFILLTKLVVNPVDVWLYSTVPDGKELVAKADKV